MKFGLNDEVKITMTGETGTVRGRAEWSTGNKSYFVAYKSASGDFREVWLDEDLVSSTTTVTKVPEATAIALAESASKREGGLPRAGSVPKREDVVTIKGRALDPENRRDISDEFRQGVRDAVVKLGLTKFVHADVLTKQLFTNTKLAINVNGNADEPVETVDNPHIDGGNIDMLETTIAQLYS